MDLNEKETTSKLSGYNVNLYKANFTTEFNSPLKADRQALMKTARN